VDRIQFDESGRYEIYIRPFPGPASAILVSSNGGENPKWPEWGEIFYRGLGSQLMAAPAALKAKLPG
jgi:hypothetical protein